MTKDERAAFRARIAELEQGQAQTAAALRQRMAALIVERERIGAAIAELERVLALLDTEKPLT